MTSRQGRIFRNGKRKNLEKKKRRMAARGSHAGNVRVERISREKGCGICGCPIGEHGIFYREHRISLCDSCKKLKPMNGKLEVSQ